MVPAVGRVLLRDEQSGPSTRKGEHSVAVVSMKQLLELAFILVIKQGVGAKMAPYIFTERNGIYIIDLQKTVRKIDEAYLRKLVAPVSPSFCWN